MDNRFRLKSEHNYLKTTTFAHGSDLVAFAKSCGKEVGLDLIDGCYNVWPLPNFESAADI